MPASFSSTARHISYFCTRGTSLKLMCFRLDPATDATAD
jgi:hypothetical protein